MSAGSKITATVFENGNEDVFDECIVTKVEHEDKEIDSFLPISQAKKCRNINGHLMLKLTVEIVYTDAYDKAVSFNFFIDRKRITGMVTR